LIQDYAVLPLAWGLFAIERTSETKVAPARSQGHARIICRNELGGTRILRDYENLMLTFR